jgi:CHAT domain-containing protein/Tfp pilus assembly protein PilF
MFERLCVCAVIVLFALSVSGDVPIGQGEMHEERFHLPTNRLVTLEVVQYDIDLEARVLDPAGEEVVRGALEYDPRISFVTRDTGTYRLVLEPDRRSSQLGAVHVSLLEIRSVTEQDAERLEGRRTFLDAVMLLRTGSAIEAAKAIEPLERALEHARAVGDCDLERRALHGLAMAYGSMEDRATSTKYFHAALQLHRERGDVRTMAGTLVGAASQLWQADVDAARAFLEESLAISRVLRLSTTEAEAHNFLGRIAGAHGDHRASIEHYEDALAASQRAGNPFQEALFTNNIAVSLAALGDWRGALAHFDRAIPLYRRIGEKRQLGLTLQNVGAAYVWLGEYREALAQFRLALPLILQTGDRSLEGSNYMNSAVAQTELGRLDEARQSLKQALAVARQLEDLRLEALVYRHMGRLEDREKRHALALAHHERSLLLHRAVGNRRGESFALLNIGTLQRKLGDADAARKSIGDAHALACNLDDPALDAATRLALARVDAGEGRLEDAWRQLDAALHGVESRRGNLAGQHLRGAYQLTVREYYELSIDLLMRMKRHAEALEINERARARGLLDLLAEAQVDVRADGDPDLLAREKKLRRAINDKAALHARAQKKEELGRQLDAMVAELHQLERRLRESSPRYASLTQPETLTLREIQHEVLDDDTLLVEISLGAERGHVWAVTKNSVTVRELPSRNELETLARRFYDALTARNTRIDGETPQARLARLATAKQRIERDGARLYELLLAPLPLRNRSRLLIVADGALQYVPFAALPANGQPLVARFELVYMPSVSALAALRRDTHGRHAAERSVAVLADPTSPSSPLPMAREEATSIARVAYRPEVRVGPAATRAAAMSGELRRFRYVHFATHGVLDDRHPELSGIALSDGLLRLHDVYNLELAADLVVLSACETAVGKEVAHEGLIGLTRGFMYAGAPRVLASLWKIDDRATAELMRRLYEHMLVGRQTPAAALRAAQVEMAASPRWSEPYHWAAFVLQGEWRP